MKEATCTDYSLVCPNSSTNQCISGSVQSRFKLKLHVQDDMSGTLDDTGNINILISGHVTTCSSFALLKFSKNTKTCQFSQDYIII